MSTLGGVLGVSLDAMTLDSAVLRIQYHRLCPSDAATATRPRNGPSYAVGVCRQRERLAKVLEKTHLNDANFISVLFPGNSLEFRTVHMQTSFMSNRNSRPWME